MKWQISLFFAFHFKDNDNGSNDFTLSINTQITITVRDLIHVLVTGKHVTYNNFNLYRNDFAKILSQISVSETNTPASSVIATENNSSTLMNEIKKYKMKELIDFLRKEEDLELEPEDYDIIEKKRINGHTSLKITKEKLRSYGMKGEPASNITVFAKECKEKKLKSFSSYKTKKDLKEVLAKYGIDDGISCMSKNPLNIQFTESVLKEGSEEEKELHKNM
ncbi:hypothetical protein C1645_831732 [Glomus cerebriforme]|uniref:SAM domain-containing protein n=1 Tax=Glomus cerebriforme TaxID=658196 RepID=A0A397SJJ4_9GLOM|nr:hypothetical protein C1645_831732 [Glomus cerebriforme]